MGGPAVAGENGGRGRKSPQGEKKGCAPFSHCQNAFNLSGVLQLQTFHSSQVKTVKVSDCAAAPYREGRESLSQSL